MQVLVMCGGRGTRLRADAEKPLFPVDGTPMVERVLAALGDSRIDGTYAVVSPNAPETRAHLRECDVTTIETPGEGYVADLGRALANPRVERPVLTVAADLPLLTTGLVDSTLDRYEADVTDGALTVCAPVALKDALGVSAETTHAHGGTELAPTGLNVVGESDGASDGGTSGGGTSDDVTDDGTDDEDDDETDDETRAETVVVSWDARLAVNVNYRADAEVAEKLAAAMDVEGRGVAMGVGEGGVAMDTGEYSRETETDDGP